MVIYGELSWVKIRRVNGCVKAWVIVYGEFLCLPPMLWFLHSVKTLLQYLYHLLPEWENAFCQVTSLYSLWLCRAICRRPLSTITVHHAVVQSLPTTGCSWLNNSHSWNESGQGRSFCPQLLTVWGAPLICMTYSYFCQTCPQGKPVKWWEGNGCLHI